MRFIDRQNRTIDTFPEGLEEKLRYRCTGRAAYFSWLIKDETEGICQEIYGAKVTKGKLHIQKIAVVSESGSYLFRNCFLGGITGTGFFSYGYDGKGRSVQGCWLQYDTEFGEWDIDAYRKCPTSYLFGMDRITELDNSLRYCAWKPFLGIRFIEYLRLYRRHPQTVEFVSKLGLSRLLTERAMEEISKDIGLAKWISRHSAELKGMAFQTVRNAYHKNPCADPRDYATSLQYRIDSGRACALRNKVLYSKVLKHTTQERIAKYIRDSRIDKATYEDYLVACDWLKLDLSDTKVLFPHDFRSLHLEYTTQYARAMAEEKETMSKTTDASMYATADRFGFVECSRDGYCVVIARCRMDLIDEGAYLHHCVGKMDYDRRQADGKSLICFIRRQSEPAIPFVTAEVKITDGSLRVAQCYGDHNNIIDEVKPFVDSWMRTANRRLRRQCA